MESALGDLIDEAAGGDRLVVFLTGAGISAESGIPTFRGEEGYWTVGSRVYHPQELATWAAFSRMPAEVWEWYLYRRGVCRGASPNRAHAAIAELERALGDRFRLITQNVDGLHLRAGNSPDHTYQIHGNIEFMRCSADCSVDLTLIPEQLGARAKAQTLTGAELELLRCHHCGARSRPHVLWFDESYDEPLFRLDSSLHSARNATLLVTVGTSGATTLPAHVVSVAARSGAALIDVNPEPNPFSAEAERLARGVWARGSACEMIPAIAERIAASRSEAERRAGGYGGGTPPL